MTDLTPEHKLLCDVAAVRAHLDKYSRIEQRALLGRVMEHLNAVVEAQRTPAQSLTGCLHPIGPLSCQNHGKCQSMACNHYGKTECRPRMTVLARDPNVLYPKETT